MLTTCSGLAYSHYDRMVSFSLPILQVSPVLTISYLAPESPWWQVRHGHLDAARATIRRLNRNITEQQVNANLALIMHTNAMEKAVSEGTQYWDLFKGVDRRRTEVACGTWIVQNACGSGT